MSKFIISLAIAAVTPFVFAQDEIKKPIEVSSDNMLVRPFTLSDFTMEIALLATFIAYIFLWYSGKSSNLSKAKKWLGGQIDYLESQFALVGDKKSNKSILMADGPADYLLYTTGRRNVQFGHWWLKTKPRNDVLTLFSTQVLSLVGYAKPATDRIELKMHLDKGLPEKFVFAVVKKDLAEELHKKRFDLNHVCKIASSKVIPNNLVIYSETQKLADSILSTKIGDIINQSADRFESLVISSLPAEEPEMYDSDGSITITLHFLMSDSGEFEPLVQLASEGADWISQLRLPSDVKSKVNKNREELLKEFSKKAAANRAEELAKKKADAKRAEEERIKKMSPAEQRKYDEKERQRSLKKQQKKRMVK